MRMGTRSSTSVATKPTRRERATSSARTTRAACAKLHVKLVELQEWVRHEGKKICIVFEGRDGAGKGGTIKAITPE